MAFLEVLYNPYFFGAHWLQFCVSYCRIRCYESACACASESEIGNRDAQQTGQTHTVSYPDPELKTVNFESFHGLFSLVSEKPDGRQLSAKRIEKSLRNKDSSLLRT
jgi:hypothetical protein